MDSLLTSTGCDSVITTTLTLYPATIAGISGDLDICEGDSTLLTASGGGAYSWNTGESSSTISIKPSVTSTYTVIVTNGNGCKDTATVVVNVYKSLKPNITSTSSGTCPGSADASATASIPAGPDTYLLHWNTVPVQNTLTATNLKAGTYYAILQSSRGCSDSTSITLIDPDSIQFTINTSNSACGSSTGALTISNITNGSSPYEFSVDGGAWQSTNPIPGLAAGTHTISVQDAFLCAVSKNFTINSSSGPTAFATTATDASCGASNGTLKVSNIIGGSAPYQYKLNSGTFQADSNFAGLAAGSQTITIKDGNNCLYSQSTTINSGQGVTSFTILSSPETCHLGNGNLRVRSVAGSTSPYTYSLNGSVFQSDSNFVNLDSGQYTINVKDANGCSFSRDTVVVNNGGLDSLVITLTTATCTKANGAVSLQSYGSSPPFVSSFNSGPFLNQNSYTALPPGVDSITVSDRFGCTAKKVFTITDIPGPTSFSISTIQPGCNQNNGSITITGITGGTPPYQYLYDTIGAVYTSTTVYPLQFAGVHKFVAKDATGCLLPFTIILSNPPGPRAIAVNSTVEDCGTNNGKITVSGVTGGIGPYQYSLNGSPFSTTNSFISLDSGFYQITVRDNNNCTFDTLYHLGFNAGPTNMTVNVKAASCGRSDGSVEITSITGGRSPFSYSFQNGTQGTDTTFSNIAPGNFTVSGFDAGGCRIDVTVLITNIPGPSAINLLITNDTCGRNTGRIKVLSATGPARPFSFSINTIPGTDADSTFFVASGTGYVITATDTNGCTFTKNVTVGVINGPGPVSFSTTAPHCGKNTGTLQVITATGTTPLSFNIGAQKDPPLNKFTGLAQGSYSLEVTDANKCTFDTAFTLIDIAGPTFFDTTTTPATCGLPNGGMKLQNVVGGSQPYSFSIDSLSFTYSGGFSGLLGGTYRVIVADSFGCTFGRNVLIRNISGPSAVNASPVDEHCDQQDGALTNLSNTGGTAPFTFLLNGAQAQNAGSSYTGLDSGLYIITVTDANSCPFRQSFRINNTAPPTAGFTQSEYAGESPLIVVFSDKSVGANSFFWVLGDLSTSTEASPTHTYQDDGELIITQIVTDNFGCSDTAYGSISIRPFVSIYAPNAFTPDDDGFNDQYSIITMNIVSYTLNIYTRWGEDLITLNEKQPHWNGQYKGKQAEEGLYEYHLVSIDIFGKKYTQTGTINLIR